VAFRRWSPLAKVAIIVVVLFAVYFIVATLLVVFAGHTHHSGI
jgi:hypothetical protein